MSGRQLTKIPAGTKRKMRKWIASFFLALFGLAVCGGILPQQQKIQVPQGIADEKQQQPLVVHVIAHTHDVNECFLN